MGAAACFNGEDASKYCLGDDALSCLRDIKRWLKLYDEKTNRMDVARCLGEANLVNGDLLPILCSWWEYRVVGARYVVSHHCFPSVNFFYFFRLRTGL